MVRPKAVVRVQVHFADRASEVRPTAVSPPPAAANAVASLSIAHGPMANEGPVYYCWGCGLSVGEWGGGGHGYVCQEPLAEGQQAGLSVVVETPELVGVTNAHIE